ncbi:MAG: hypothetical protein AAB229_00840 [Candidatus Hydrogenedentota bacterium]
MIDIQPAIALMERDEANLRATAMDGECRAEIYRFASRSVTAGRNAKVSDADVARWGEQGHAFARRPTGGGILRHDGDISFGFTFPIRENEGDPSCGPHLRRVSAAIAAALLRQGIETHPASAGSAAAPSHCFQRAVGCELMRNGRKLLGLAARRIRGAVLVQGSLTVARDETWDRAIIGVGPEIDLEGTGFQEDLFEGALLELLRETKPVFV